MRSPTKTLTLIATLAALAAAAPPASALELEPCRIDAGPALDTTKALCGTFERAENPDAPDGRKIALSVALVPALNVEALPDPLVFLAGGPGQSAIDSYLAMPSAFEQIRRDRPILLVDQRGTGRSNRLDCPLPENGDLSTGDWDPEEMLAYTRDCLESLDGDPRFYTTSVAVDDLDAVRAELGIEQLNLWGGSYGTRVALHYLRKYPEQTRSVIIDGVIPGDELLGPAIATDAQASLDFLFDRCAETADCNEAFPNLADTFDALRQQLDDTPVTLSVAHPTNGELVELNLRKDTLTGVVRMSTYSPTTRALLPLMISEAAQGRYTMLAAQAALIETQFQSLLAMGMHNSVVCSEDAPSFAERDVDDAMLDATYIGKDQLEALELMCSIWPRGPVDEGFNEAVVSDVPVLVLSGEVDPVTPPSNGDKAAQTLSTSRHIVAPGQGHIISALGCMPRLLGEFVNGLDPAAIDDTCMQRLGATPFFVGTVGPTP